MTKCRLNPTNQATREGRRLSDETDRALRQLCAKVDRCCADFKRLAPGPLGLNGSFLRLDGSYPMVAALNMGGQDINAAGAIGADSLAVAGAVIVDAGGIDPATGSTYSIGAVGLTFAEGHFDDLFTDTITIGGVLQTKGIADGTTQGAMLYWDVVSAAWVEDTGIRRTAAGELTLSGDLVLGGVTQTAGIADGTVQGAMLYWDNTAGEWVEAPLVTATSAGLLTAVALRANAGAGGTAAIANFTGTGTRTHYSMERDSVEVWAIRTTDTGSLLFTGGGNNVFNATAAGGTVIGVAGQTHTIFSTTVDFAAASVLQRVGTGTGGPEVRLRKADAFGSYISFYGKGTSLSADDKRFTHWSDESLRAQHWDGALWQDIWYAVGQDVTFAGDVTIGGVTMTAGIADGTTQGAVLYWDAGSGEWVEETTIRREAANTLRVGVSSGVLRLGDNGDTMTYGAGTIRISRGASHGFVFDGADVDVGIAASTGNQLLGAQWATPATFDMTATAAVLKVGRGGGEVWWPGADGVRDFDLILNGGALRLRPFNAGGGTNPDVINVNAGGTITRIGQNAGSLYTDATTFVHDDPDPNFYLGDSLGSPEMFLRKAAGGSNFMYWMVGTTASVDGNFRHWHDSVEAYRFQQHITSWVDVWSVAAGSQDVTFAGDIVIGGVTQTGGIPDAVSSHSTLRWNSAAWVATTGLTCDVSGNVATLGTLTAGGQLKAADGSPASPALAFTNDTNTGFYRVGLDTLGVVTAGADRWRWTSVGTFVPTGNPNIGGSAAGDRVGTVYSADGDFSDDVTVGDSVFASDGAAATPAYSFTSDPDTGLFAPATNSLGFAAAGVELMRLDGVDTDLVLGTDVNIGIGIGFGNAVAAGAFLEAQNSGTYLRVADPTTNNAVKSVGILSGHYATANDDLLSVFAQSTSIANFLLLGTSFSGLTAPTIIRFATAPNTTSVGVNHWDIDSSGHLVPINSGRNIGDDNDGINHLFFDETATLPTPTAGFGGLAVLSATPNVLYFTDDAGFDHPLSMMQEIPLSVMGCEWNPDPAVSDTLGDGSGAVGDVLVSSTPDTYYILLATGALEVITWKCELPFSYSGNGLRVHIKWQHATNQSGNDVDWEAAFERIEDGTMDPIGASNFAAARGVTESVTTGQDVLRKTTIDFTDSQIDGLQAGETFRIAIRRDGVSDTYTSFVRYISGKITEINSLAA